MNADLINNIDLRDIHVPEDVSWWPLATGWWLIIITVITAVLCIYYRIWKQKQAKTLRKMALREFTDIKSKQENTSDCFIEVYLLLRRICKLLPGGFVYARSTDAEWMEWLSIQSGLTACPEKLKQQVAEIPYQPPRRVDTEEIIEFASVIINQLPERSIKDLSSSWQ